MISLYISEALRSIAQSFFGCSLFEFLGIRRIREQVYCRILGIRLPATFISKHVMFYRSHLNAVADPENVNPKKGTVTAGHHIAISSDVKIDYTGGITIGDYVDISENVRIYTHGHVLCADRMSFKPSTIETSDLTIGDRVWIGAGSIILSSVQRIGNNAIIGAGSVVTKNVADNVVVAGNPAAVIRELKDNEYTKG